MNYFYVLAIIFTMSAMVCTYFASKKDGEKTEKKLNSTIIQQTENIKELTKKNTELSEANINLSKFIHSNTKELTSDGSRPSVNIGGSRIEGDKIQFIVLLNGEYAIENLTVRLAIIPDYRKISGLNLCVTGMMNSTDDLGTLRKSEFKNIFVKNKTGELAVVFYFSSNNKQWVDTIRIHDTDKGLEYLYQGNNGTKRITDNFPRNRNGEIQLWSNVAKKYEEI